MEKYFIILKNSIAEAIVYRAGVFFTLAGQLLSLVVFFSLYKAIYSQGSALGNYTLDSLLAYYFIMAFFSFSLQGFDIAWKIGDEIRLGQITSFIFRPISYLKNILAIALGKMLFNTAIALIIFSVAYLIFRPNLPFKFDVEYLFFLLLAILNAFLIRSLYFYIVGILAFWLDTIMGINFISWNIMLMLSGSLIPLDLMPAWLSKINDWLPFKYILWQPIAIALGKIEPNFSTFYPAFFWAIILTLLASLIYKKGIRKYEGVGA